MKENSALGLIELRNIADGVLALDEMLKSADIVPEVAQHVSGGKYIIIVSGPLGEVESALMREAEVADESTLKRLIIRNVHGAVVKAFNRKVKPSRFEAVGMLETKDSMSAVYAADIAAKAASVDIVEIRTGKGIGGKGYFTVAGEVGSVKTAIGEALSSLEDGEVVSRIIIPNAHRDAERFICGD